MNGFDPVSRLSAGEIERETVQRTEETERLAALFAQAVPQPLRDRLGLPEQAPESSESWRGGVGNLTQETSPTPAAVVAEASGAPSDTLVFTLRAGDLGELKCMVDRSDSGVRVLIGADGRNALTAAGAERGALEAALRAAGLPVQSVAVVPLSKFGTSLARGERAQDGRHVRQAFTGSRGRARRVKLIG
ncbi:MAG TPA: hypothetical protein VMI54_27340 [Polyangiaceae bacterium]|nr:hypothetical protein [Polyangiaceae bacterium]